MTYAQAVDYLRSLKPGGMKWGLERIERALELCGHPERRLHFVHVAGTNGKGSTARMIQSILTAAGYRTGLYASPAVTGLRDTITVDSTPISEEEFAGLTDRLRSFEQPLGEVGGLSEFELTTALAFMHFAARHTDICVAECGLGGRDDATNCIPAPLAAVLTPISLDHTAILGSTIAQIAANKCGILKAPCAVVTSPEQNDDALAVILEAAASKGLTVHIPSAASAPLTRQELGCTAFTYDNMTLTMPLTGGFQRANALTAIETVRTLGAHGFPVTNEQIAAGLATALMPCRQEVIRRDPLIVLDGAHNPQGVGALADTLRLHHAGDFTLVTGMLKDKDVSSCMRLLLPFCRRVICCTPDNSRALDAGELASLVRSLAPQQPVEIAEQPARALRLAQSGEPSPLLIAGSFYVAGVLRPLLIEGGHS